MERRGTGRRVAVAAHLGRVGQCTARAKVAGLVARGGRTVQRRLLQAPSKSQARSHDEVRVVWASLWNDF